MGTEIFDVAVIGGGTAGTIAAVQAARAGAKTLLVEKNGICGGTMTAGGINFPGLFDAWGKQIIRGIGWELITRTLELTGGKLPEKFLAPDSNHEHWRHQIRISAFTYAALADEALLRAGADVRFHTILGALARRRGQWRITLCGKDGLYDVTSRIIIDCTGDANAVKIAGYPYCERAETQPGSLSVYCHNFAPENLDAGVMEQNFVRALENGELRIQDLGWSGKFSMSFLSSRGNNANHITGINACDSQGRTAMEIAGRQSLARVYRFLKQQPGLAGIEFLLNAAECGVRESRVIAGEHTVTGEEYLAGTRYPDAVCNAFYPIDLHDTAKGLINEWLAPGTVPQVPLRALVPEGSEYLLAAGRILSSDRAANSALRVQAVCMACGQAAGAVAALAAAHRCPVLAVPVPEWRALLEKHGAILPSD